MPLDAPDNWPQIGRGGHLRNAKGQALVIPPGGGRPRIAIGGSDLDAFEGPYYGDPIYGDQGTHVHVVTEWADAGRAVDAELISAGEAVGIDEATTRHIHDSYLAFIKDLGWSTVLTECIVVNDCYGTPIASNIDKVMLDEAGVRVVVDVKSGKDYAKRGYVLQAAAYVDAQLYDPATGERTPIDVDPDEAFIFHYPLRGDRTWSCIPIDVAGVARPLLERFMALRDDDSHTAAFVTPIASAASPADDAPDTATHGNAAVSVEHDAPAQVAPAAAGASELEIVGSTPSESSDTLAEFFDQIEANPAGATIDIDEATATIRAHRDGQPSKRRGKTLDGLRTESQTWQPEDVAELVAYFDRNDTDKTDAAQVAEAMDAVEHFRTTETTPAPREPVAAPVAPVVARDIDEGSTITADAVKTAGARYLALNDVTRSWVTRCGELIRMSGANGRPTERRRLLLAGLCTLAEGLIDDDDAVRAIAAHAGLGDGAYHGETAADVIGALSHPEAVRFAGIAELVAMSPAPFEWHDDGRCVLTSQITAHRQLGGVA